MALVRLSADVDAPGWRREARLLDGPDTTIVVVLRPIGTTIGAARCDPTAASLYDVARDG